MHFVGALPVETDRSPHAEISRWVRLRVAVGRTVTVTGDYFDDGSIADTAAFQAVLGEAVERAVKVDVDVRGAWEVETA